LISRAAYQTRSKENVAETVAQNLDGELLGTSHVYINSSNDVFTAHKYTHMRNYYEMGR